MDNNLKLRKAIIIAIALMGTGYSLHSKAIGLSDIQVKSYLGQPLLANIKVSGLDKKMDERCFSIASDDTNAISNVNFKLNRTSDETGILSLTSNKAVLEPIASLTVVGHCDAIFTRQYQLLIDPASTISNVDTDTNGEMTISHNAEQSSFSEAETETASTLSTNAATVKTARKSKRQASATKQVKASNPDSAAVVSTSNNAAHNAQIVYNTPKPSVAAPVESKPRLSISSGDVNFRELANVPMKLAFDKRINTSRETNPQAYSEQAEFADEVTVMNNRLAHLDKQLNSLYAQNASLKQANTNTQAELTTLKQQNDVLRMLSFCLGGGLLATGYFFVDWLRRRNAVARAENEQALWVSLQAEQHAAESNLTFGLDESFEPQTSVASTKPQEELSDMGNAPLFNSTYPSQAMPEIIQEETHITEDAELLISHGRIHLAIELLQNHLIETPKDSASTWLFLLDLLAKEGMQKEFEVAATECKKHFNVQLEDFSRPLADSNSLESFERISKELQKLWGTEKALVFLDELIYNTRLEPRAGFDKPVFEELVLLREIAEEEVKLAEVISLHEEKTSRRQKKEKTMTINLPEIETSEAFKQLALETSKDNVEIANEEHFEFELLDLARN